MAASVIHRCQHCTFETDLGASLDIFEQNPHCGRCGLSASEGDMKMQEELATLMSQQLKLDNKVSFQNLPELPSTPPQSDNQPQITYITQHYHHSSHQAAPTPPVEPTSATDELARHGIDANVLFPSQLKLFKQAQPEQQIRLIELWSIAPSKYGNQMLAKDLVNWPQTSMRLEEQAAQSRYMRMQAESGQYSPEARASAEPYILRGYNNQLDTNDGTAAAGYGAQSNEYNRALDPAHMSREWWVHETQPIEHQYGVVQQMRQFADQDEDMS
ncbi:hypothetical protein GJ744_002483 [Endocarpon pusillum]|uniref:Uncharacterized protein n=1 Tax=Endocarpon pusillum TaxID=364733 RepID=A0A8H7DYT1_9EURO|nr:hypothetical protein GJ744_002483 [Endocarpon pusillum]